MTVDHTNPEDEPAVLRNARAQRQLALASIWFAAIVSAAVLLSNFGPQPSTTADARIVLETHQKILTDEQLNFQTSEQALKQNQLYLATLLRERRIHP